MKLTYVFRFAALILVLAASAASARAQTNPAAGTTGAAALVASDLSLRVFVFDDTNKEVQLTPAEAESYLNETRCRCGAPVLFRVVLESTGIEKLKTEVVDSEMWWGSDCGTVEGRKSCTPLGEGRLGQGTGRVEHTATATTLFKGATSSGADACQAFEGSRSIFLLLRKDGKPLDLTITRALRLDSKAPEPPTLTAVQSGNGALELTWKPSSTPQLRGYQALCTPGAEMPSKPAWTSCVSPDTEEIGSAGAVPCSELIGTGQTKARVEDLTNGTAYSVALVALDAHGNVSPPSKPLTAAPGPSKGFYDVYQEAGGVAEGGCSLGGGSARGGGAWGIFGLLGFVAGLHRSRRRRLMTSAAIACACIAFSATPSRAELDLGLREESIEGPPVSPRTHVLSVGVGFYRPAIDSEFGAGGVGPFARVFSDDRRALWQLRLERIVWQGFGTLSLGLGGGYYKATAAAFAGNTTAASADETSLGVIPFSADVAYRLDPWRRRGVPLIPYARAGLDTALWSMAVEGSPTKRGSTAGWHAAAGLSLALESLDPESAVKLDQDAGINGTQVFLEVNRTDLSGLGRARRLTLSDITLSVGVALEL